VITAVDSSVLIDVLTGHVEFGRSSGRALRAALVDGAVVACDVVWAEAAGWFRSIDEFGRVMSELAIGLDPLTAQAAELAGQTWGRYRDAGGPRARLVPDFLIAAHAQVQTDRLLARDRGFTRRWFDGLTVVDPTDA
jgi:predicted nucleic acid-binding protein